MSVKTLIVTVGLPRCGKSTWSKEQKAVIVNPDSVRLAVHGERFIGRAEPWVWAISYVMADALFLAGHDTVIIDGTHVSKKRRDVWFNYKFSQDVKVKFKVFGDISVSECIDRARKINDDLIQPVIERMATEWDVNNDENVKNNLYIEPGSDNTADTKS